MIGLDCPNAPPNPDAPVITAATWEADTVDQDQRVIALITEMIHTASLVHDDVIDEASVGLSGVFVRVTSLGGVFAPVDYRGYMAPNHLSEAHLPRVLPRLVNGTKPPFCRACSRLDSPVSVVHVAV